MRSRAELVGVVAAALAAAGCAQMQPDRIDAGEAGGRLRQGDQRGRHRAVEHRHPHLGRPRAAAREAAASRRARRSTTPNALACHGADAKGGAVYGTMVGGVGSFTTNARVLTPGSMYPYAPILFDYIRRTMPMDRPQSLTADEVYALSAYILNLNGLVPANAVMDAKTLPAVQMPNRNGFIVDDRPDAKAVRCMTNCK